MATTGIGMMMGLSPPARGNRLGNGLGEPSSRSIPARAGQPARRGGSGWPAPVYPRPRGATRTWRRHHLSRRGLSPPARGNHVLAGPNGHVWGSIPARAGQPKCPRQRTAAVAVYPRPRGATMGVSYNSLAGDGLSPPARGNQMPRWESVSPAGSIPARAGQPRLPPLPSPEEQVYPRPRGATVREMSVVWSTQGLSPPARGNLLLRGLERCGERSIPARAGQPGTA